MIDTPQITETRALTSAVIRLTIPKADIGKEMGPGITEVMAAVRAQGIGPAGPWYTRHFRIDPEVWDFEIGVPVHAPVAPVGRVVPGSLPAARVARTVYHGGYEGLGAGWGEFTAWIEAQGLSPGADLWEVYTAGPETGADPSRWRTELNRPLLG